MLDKLHVSYVMITQTMTLILNDDNTGYHNFVTVAVNMARKRVNTFLGAR